MLAALRRRICCSKILRTVVAIAIAYGFYQTFVTNHWAGHQTQVNNGTLIFLGVATALAIVGLLASVVHWQAKNCGLLSLLVGLELNVWLNVSLIYDRPPPRVDRWLALTWACLVVGAMLLVAAVFKYFYDGIKLPPPYNSIRHRRRLRRKQLEALRRQQEIDLLSTGLDDPP